MIKISVFLLAFTFFSCGSNSDKSKEKIENTTTEKTTDEQLLDQVQKEAIKYFWEYAETNSKLARERYLTDDPNFEANKVTTGGSGFGLMSLIVGVERGFIPRAAAVTRMTTAMDFLAKADRFHGAWAHWMDGVTGKAISFGNKDDGGDIVETAFLCQGLIAVREYFKDGNYQEKALAAKADNLWKTVEWNWYTNGENAMYWHWSPNYGWEMKFKLEGYNECLIAYILGAASPTHPIPTAAYHEAWTRSGSFKTDKRQYGIPLVLKYNTASGNAGPLFWAQYSYLGLDPSQLTDKYANYWELTQNQAKIMYQHAIVNPNKLKGYSEKCWGLTASYSRKADGTTGYSAHDTDNDLGIISPTAALSSFPYTPKESMRFLQYLYNEKKADYVGIAGPYDAFSPHYNWVTKRYLAIDQGTIAPMIENYRTGLLWKLFMNAPEVQSGLITLGFHSEKYNF